ncbi:MAG: c-type cytochrome domain-containing protein, partial [Rubripirellula sp.]
MNAHVSAIVNLLGKCTLGVLMLSNAVAQEPATLQTDTDATGSSNTQTLEEVKTAGALRSSYRKPISQANVDEILTANLNAFRTGVEPVLKNACYRCHGAETAEGEFRLDTLDPDLLHGEDVKKWLDVSAAVTNGEMPPEDGPELADDDRVKIVEWLSAEIQIASKVRRVEQRHSSFRRMTRYEY